MKQIPFRVFYPAVNRDCPNPSDESKEFSEFIETENSCVDLCEICERIFAGMNHGSGIEFDWLLKARCRSMSVGDVVFFPETDKYFICNSCGWGSLTKEQFQSWMEYPRKYGCCGFEVNEWRDSHAEEMKESV